MSWHTKVSYRCLHPEKKLMEKKGILKHMNMGWISIHLKISCFMWITLSWSIDPLSGETRPLSVGSVTRETQTL